MLADVVGLLFRYAECPSAFLLNLPSSHLRPSEYPSPLRASRLELLLLLNLHGYCRDFVLEVNEGSNISILETLQYLAPAQHTIRMMVVPAVAFPASQTV